jgi:predicted nucleic acid-binding Zn ribbon protein
MKNNNQCPKCNSTDILKIIGRPGYGHTGTANIILAGIFRRSVPVTRYLCTSCGYSEEWVEKKKDIQKLIDEYKYYP